MMQINYSTLFNLTGYSDGQHIIHYFSTNKAGNVETTKTISIILVNANPSTTYSPSEGTHSEMITITLAATDGGSGVKETYYKIGEGEWTKYTDPFNITEPGDYTIYYYGTDNLGNRELTKSACYTIEAPTNVSAVLVSNIHSVNCNSQHCSNEKD